MSFRLYRCRCSGTTSLDDVQRKYRNIAGWISAITIAGLVGCAASAQSAQRSGADFAAHLRHQVNADDMFTHLGALQDIADAHDGNRAVGTSGFDASVDYVAGVLRASGFDVHTPEFTTKIFEAQDPDLTVNGDDIDADALNFSAATPPEGVSGPLVVAPAASDDQSPGCTESDYDGLVITGAVVLVDRGECSFATKEAVAAQQGAIALIVADNVDQERLGATLGADTDVAIPVVGITKSLGEQLRSDPGLVTVNLDATTKTITSRNVIAQTNTGSTRDVVVVGAHLDSVPEGPGINDNGSGVSAVLQTAVKMGSTPDIANAVRFAFWGAEEIGLVGSVKYVESLTTEQLKDIALYLNFDMVASPNPGYFTYDGNQSTAPDQENTVPRVPEGSAGIERTLTQYLAAAGKAPEDTSFNGRSDYDAFTRAGVPAGGLFSGGSDDKTTGQQQLWGGTADAPFDPNYHKDADNIDNIDRTALDIQGGGVAYAVGLYAQDLSGRNGIPIREDRTRHSAVD